LEEGKQLISVITGLQYKLIDGHLFSRNSESKKWIEGELTFMTQSEGLNFHYFLHYHFFDIQIFMFVNHCKDAIIVQNIRFKGPYYFTANRRHRHLVQP